MPYRFPGLLEGSPHGVPDDCRLSHPPSVLAVVSQPSLPVEEVPSVAVQSHFPTCSLVLPRSRRRRGLDEIPGNSPPLPLRTLSSTPVSSGLTARTNSALPAVSNQSVSMLTPSDLEARRREIQLGKRLADDVPSVPTESVPYADSSDDELSSYCSALAAGFFPDGESSNATTHVNVPSNPSDLNAWALFPSAHSSTLGSLAQPGPSLPQIVGSDDDLPNMGTVGLRYLARVHPTPCIPATRRSLNRRMRVAVRHHRAFLRAGYQVGSVQLPLSADFISMLKRALVKTHITTTNEKGSGVGNTVTKYRCSAWCITINAIPTMVQLKVIPSYLTDTLQLSTDGKYKCPVLNISMHASAIVNETFVT